MSNGKKLGVKSKVSDNYLVTGNDYEKFQEALHDMDNRTVIIPVRNPESMRIHCVIAKSDKEHASPRFVVLDPMEMKDSILLSDESIFSAEKCNIGRYKPTSEVFLSLQNQIKEIEQIGFFLTVHDQKKIIVTPSKKFLTALCQRLETGTLAKGTNIFAYCYLASRCVQAKEFIIIGRKEEKDSSWVKGFHAASTRYAYIPQHFILRELQNFQENHDVTTLGWELSNYYTTIELIFQDKTVDMGKAQVKLGVKYSLSDVGTSSQTVQPILVYGDNSVLIGKSFSSPHRSKKTPEEIGKELVNAIEKQLPELEAKITATFKKASTISVGMDEQEKIISKIMKMIHTEKVGVRRKQYITAKLSVFSYRFSRFPMAVTISSDVSRKNGVRNQKLFQKGDGRNLYA